MNRKNELHAVVREFEGADLGDARRMARLVRIADQIARQPDASLPKIAGSEIELEALYRFLNNAGVEFEDVLEPHQRLTARRAVEAGEVVVVHDTTAFQFCHADPRELGYLQTGKTGFYGHFSLVVTADGERRPLGVSATRTIFRRQKRKADWSRKIRAWETRTWEDRESKRWDEGITKSEELLAGCSKRIHVADREADSYALLARLGELSAGFVLRVRNDRKARSADEDEPEWSSLKDLATSAESCLEREVALSARRKKSAPDAARRFPQRKRRMAKLQFAASHIELCRPRYLGPELPARLSVNVVRVWETDAPDQEPVEWLLMTSEPVETPEQVARVVDLYRTRWVIEEYFKALKTGCIYEERQLESRHALLNALALFLPVACHLLWLRSRAHHAPDSPATEVLTRRQIVVLRTVSKRKLGADPTAREVLLAIAALGGHLKNNGDPGWETLRHGLERLLDFEVGWVAARSR
jgi:hypothetical protein